jgi:hypothetical protein
MRQKLAFFGLIAFFSSMKMSACGPLSLTYQDDINSFSTDYPGCSVIEGDLLLGYNDVMDFSPLSVITEVQGSLVIGNCSTIADFTGLHNIMHIGGELIIMSMDLIEDLSGFSSLQSVGGISIILCDNFINFNGAPNLQTISWNLDVEECGQFESFEGLENIQTLGHIGCLAQVLPNGFSGLQGILGHVDEIILNTVTIPTFNGLQGIESIGTFAVSIGNFENGFVGLESVQSADVLDLDYVNSPSMAGWNGLTNAGVIEMYNPWDDFVFPSLQGLDALIEAQRIDIVGLQISNMEGLESLGHVDTLSLGFCQNLESLNGLVGLTSAGVVDLELNESLSSLIGLGALLSVGSLHLNSCGQLSDITDLNEDLAITDTLVIYSCALSYCSTVPICQALESAELVYIEYNLTGCSSNEEVAMNCGYSYAQGSVIADMNCDGSFNDTDVPVSYISVIDENNQLQCITDNGGQYFNVMSPNSTETISAVTPPGFSSSQLIINAGTDFEAFLDQNIYLCPTSTYADLGVTHQINNAWIPGFSTTFFIEVENHGNFSSDAVVTFDFTNVPGATVIDSYGGEVNGTIITWIIEDLPLFGLETRNVIFSLDGGVPIDTPVSTLVTVDYLDGGIADQNLSDNTSESNDVVVGSYDPNDIQVNPDYVNLAEDEIPVDLEYLIRFQNTGTYLAFNVEVELPLDVGLVPATFDFISSSHNCEISLNESVMLFEFNNIMLPDSGTDLEASNGYIHFRIRHSDDVSEGDLISAQAAIYFDFNEPVITNTAITTFGMVGLNDSASIDDPFLYPNPASDVLMLSGVPAGATVSVVDLNGRWISEYSVSSPGRGIDIRSLPEGCYLAKFDNKSMRLMVSR